MSSSSATAPSLPKARLPRRRPCPPITDGYRRLYTVRAKCCHVLRAKSYSAHANLACIIQLSLQYRFTVFEYNPRSLIQLSGQAQSPKDHLISLPQSPKDHLQPGMVEGCWDIAPPHKPAVVDDVHVEGQDFFCRFPSSIKYSERSLDCNNIPRSNTIENSGTDLSLWLARWLAERPKLEREKENVWAVT